MRRFFAFILSILFLVIAPLTYVSFTLKQTILEPDTYVRLFERHHLYENVTKEFKQRFTERDEFGGLEEIPILTREETIGLIESVATKQWVYGQVHALSQELLTWLRSKAGIEELKLRVELGDVKGRALSILASLIEQKINALAVCQAGVVPTIGPGKMPNCRPAGFKAADFLSSEGFNINEFIASLPNEVDLAPFLLKGTDAQNQIMQVRQYIQIADIGVSAAILASILVFILILVVSATSGRSVFRWAGFNLFVAGAILIALTVVVESKAPGQLQRIFETPAFSFEFQNVARSMVLDFFKGMLHTVRIGGMVAAILGLLLFPLSFAVSKPMPKKKIDTKPRVKKPTLREKMGIQQ